MQQYAAKEIGSRIAGARHEGGGLTQEQFAELLNVSTRSVQDYEAGITIPWKHFQQMARIFERPVEWFLRGEQDGLGVDERLESIEVRLERIDGLLALLVKAAGTQSGPR